MDYTTMTALVLFIVLWTIPLKVYSLVLSLRRRNEKWFVALIVLNTLGILEIYYIFGVAKKGLSEFRKDFTRALSAIQ